MEVEIYEGTSYHHADENTIRDGMVLKKGVLYLEKDVHLIRFQKGSREPIEEHYHPESSGIYQYFRILGSSSKGEEENPSPAVIFRFRKAGGLGFKEVELKMGQSCFVPAGYSHGFKPKKDGLCISCSSNKPFSQAEEEAVPDKLFRTSTEGDQETKRSPLFLF